MMNLLAFLLLLISGLLIGTADPSPPMPTCGDALGPTGQIEQGPGYTGVIMPKAAASEMVNSFFAIEPDVWIPSAADIRQLETDWPAYVTREKENDPHLDIAAGGYRQYAGFIADGQHKILVNSFCMKSMTEDFDWTRHPVYVMDGGGCFYHVTYTVETHQFSHLLINGMG